MDIYTPFQILDAAMLAAMVTGLTQVIKMAGLRSRWLPVMACLLGGLLNGAWHFGVPTQELLRHVIYGLSIGLATTGLVDFGKNEVK